MSLECSPEQVLFLPSPVFIVNKDEQKVSTGRFLWTDAVTEKGKKLNHPSHDMFEFDGVIYRSAKDAVQAQISISTARQAWCSLRVPDPRVVGKGFRKLSKLRTAVAFCNTLSVKDRNDLVSVAVTSANSQPMVYMEVDDKEEETKAIQTGLFTEILQIL